MLSLPIFLVYSEECKGKSTTGFINEHMYTKGNELYSWALLYAPLQSADDTYEKGEFRVGGEVT